MSSYQRWKLRGSINRWPLPDETVCFGVIHKAEFLSGSEEKECEWDVGTIKAAAFKGNLEMIKYCVANKCPIDEDACALLPEMVISRYSNTYAKKAKHLGIHYCLFLGGFKRSSPHTRIPW